MNIVERFRDQLEGLELERLKVVRDRKAYLFLCGLLGFLALASIISAAIGRSWVLGVFSLILFALAYSAFFLRGSVDEKYQILFRERITRQWFRERFGSAYLAAKPESVNEELAVVLREAAVRVTRQDPRRVAIEDRIFFERDLETSMLLVLKETRFGEVESRALVWCKTRSDESGVVAFVLPHPIPTVKKPDIRFFKNGRPIPFLEPLATRLHIIFETANKISPHSRPRVAYAPKGVFLGCRLSHRLFAAPVDRSCIDDSSYENWERDASLPLSSELRMQINAL